MGVGSGVGGSGGSGGGGGVGGAGGGSGSVVGSLLSLARTPGRSTSEKLAQVSADFAAGTLLVNHLELCAGYVASLERDARRTTEEYFPDASERARIDVCIGALAEERVVLEQLVDGAVHRMCASLTPRLRSASNVLSGAASHISYVLDEAQLEAVESFDVFVHEFLAKLDGILAPFLVLLNPSLVPRAVTKVATYVARQVLHHVLRKRCNRLGALQLDRDARLLAAFFFERGGREARARVDRLLLLARALCCDREEEARDELLHALHVHQGVAGGSGVGGVGGGGVDEIGDRSGGGVGSVGSGGVGSVVGGGGSEPFLPEEDIARALAMRVDWLR